METKRNLLITTTNAIEGASILEYKGVITANIVMGVNFLKEFVASFSDFFGGTSGKYRKEMDRAYSLALDSLEEKAFLRKANAVVGVKVDYDEISGNGKSMLMVSISGTAVIAQFPDKRDSVVAKDSITHDTLIRLYQIEQYLSKLSDDEWLPKDSDWDVILKDSMVELIPNLLQKYVKVQRELSNTNYYVDETSPFSKISKNFHTLLDRVSYEDAVPILYGNWGEDIEDQKIYADLIVTHNLFNANSIIQKLPVIDKHVAINLLKSGKGEYEKKDIAPMKKIVDYFDSLPDTGHIEDAKGGIFSKGGKVMVCERGHRTSVEEGEYCKCGINIKGLNLSETQTIEEFRSLVIILEKTLIG